MSNYSQGHKAEEFAAKYLQELGYVIKEVNWRTPLCEVDIIACKHKTMYFVEVKYRKHSLQGKGLDYITPSKLRQMTFAANSWVQQENWSGDYELAALEVTGDQFEVTSFLPSIL